MEHVISATYHEGGESFIPIYHPASEDHGECWTIVIVRRIEEAMAYDHYDPMPFRGSEEREKVAKKTIINLIKDLPEKNAKGWNQLELENEETQTSIQESAADSGLYTLLYAMSHARTVISSHAADLIHPEAFYIASSQEFVAEKVREPLRWTFLQIAR